MPISATEFRDALGRYASGVTIITAEQGGERRGMTASAFVSVSLEPPLILVSVAKRAHMHAVLLEAPGFAVNILTEAQRPLSDHFAGRPDAALSVPWGELRGQPVIEGALVQLACTRHAVHDGGDHTLFVGEVQASGLSDARPLVYHHGGYRGVTAPLPPSPLPFREDHP